MYEKKLLLRCVSIVVARSKKESLYPFCKWLVQELISIAVKERFTAPLVTASSMFAVAVTLQSLLIIMHSGVNADVKTMMSNVEKKAVKEEEEGEKETVIAETTSSLIFELIATMSGGGAGGGGDPRIQEASRACERLARMMGSFINGKRK